MGTATDDEGASGGMKVEDESTKDDECWKLELRQAGALYAEAVRQGSDASVVDPIRTRFETLRAEGPPSERRDQMFASVDPSEPWQPCVCYVLQHGNDGNPQDWDLFAEHVRAAHEDELPHMRAVILQPKDNAKDGVFGTHGGIDQCGIRLANEMARFFKEAHVVPGTAVFMPVVVDFICTIATPKMAHRL